MKLCLIHPPQPDSLDDRLDVPLGLLYIAGSVIKSLEDLWEVKIADLSSVPKKNWNKFMGDADVYGIMIYTCAYPIALEIKKICRQISPRAVIVAGGAHPTALPEETVKDFDYVFCGESEGSFVNFLRLITSGKKVQQKIFYPDFYSPLDELPMPARDLVDLKSYHRKVGEAKATSIITSRGCPYQCAFCGSPRMFKKFRFHSRKRVIEELKLLKEKGFNNFVFYDDTFAMKRSRLYPLLEEIKKLKVNFRCNGRTSYNTYEDFTRLKEAGCHTVAFGIESGSQRILKRVKKDATVEENLRAILNAKKAGLTTKAYLVVGLPGENQESIEETKRFIKESDPDAYTLFTFSPLPGCDIWYNPEKYGIKIITKDWSQYYNIAGQNEGGITVECDTYTAEELIKLRENLLEFLKSRPWRGTTEDYEKKIKWR